MHRLSLTVLAVFGMTLATGSLAFGDEVFYLTTADHGCSPCAPANTVQVDVDLLTSSTATVTFMAETVGYGMYEAFLNVNGAFSVSAIDVTGASGGSVTSPSDHSGPLDNYKTFSETSPVVHDATEIVFHLYGGTWTSNVGDTVNNVLTPTTDYNAGFYPGGFGAAAQVRILSCSSSTQPGCTGNTGTTGSTMDSAGNPSAVPEPTSVVLFGSVALLAVGALRKKLVR
jgi:hypothetical protein